MTAATKILDRVARPHGVAPGRWMAGCPCCNSRQGRPLSIRELEDGRVLLHAFCGCDTSAILDALGLSLPDLFPERLGEHFAPQRNRIPARDVLDAIAHEVDVASIITADLANGVPIDSAALARLRVAAARIGAARAHGR